MFLSKPGTYAPCGMFNLRHLVLILLTVIGIAVAVKNTNISRKEDIKKVIRNSTIVVWVLEILKIIHIFSIGEASNLNRIVPLYYCSLLLYAGILSSVGKGKLERIGNVFLATGGIFAGIAFIIFPSTSLPEFPMFHFRSIHSFFYHGTMIYVGIIINKYKYIEVQLQDFKYYATIILAICVPAYIVNAIYGCNLMFISQNFPGTPISAIYNSTGKLFTPIMVLLQMTLPFFAMQGILQLYKRCDIMQSQEIREV
ncbi:MAG: YwaF family protein [Clostridia bacterium]|nr:YwaF family protein [Clostridia bacterium]